MRVDTMLIADAKPLTKENLVSIYEKHSPELYRYAVRFLSSRELAEDCVADTFSRLLQAVRGGGGPTENVRAYLFRVAHNWITDHYRRQPTLPLLRETEEQADPQGNPSRVVGQALEKERVRRALLRLPSEQQQVIELRFLEDWSHEEVAALLDKTVEATRALQYRALTSLRRMLLDEEEGFGYE